MRVGTRGDAARIIRTAHFGASIFALDGFNSLKKKEKTKKGQVGDDGNCGCRQVHYKLDGVLERQTRTHSICVKTEKKAKSAQMSTCRSNI